MLSGVFSAWRTAAFIVLVIWAPWHVAGGGAYTHRAAGEGKARGQRQEEADRQQHHLHRVLLLSRCNASRQRTRDMARRRVKVNNFLSKEISFQVKAVRSNRRSTSGPVALQQASQA
jgi:hypothetical protein